MMRRTTNSHKEQHDESINDDPHAIHTLKLYRLELDVDPEPRGDAAISRPKKCFWFSRAYYLDWTGALTHQIRWRVLLSDQRRGRWPLLAARQSERQDIAHVAVGSRWRSRRRVGPHRRTSLLRPATLRHAPPHADHSPRRRQRIPLRPRTLHVVSRLYDAPLFPAHGAI